MSELYACIQKSPSYDLFTFHSVSFIKSKVKVLAQGLQIVETNSWLAEFPLKLQNYHTSKVGTYAEQFSFCCSSSRSVFLFWVNLHANFWPIWNLTVHRLPRKRSQSNETLFPDFRRERGMIFIWKGDGLLVLFYIYLVSIHSASF